MLNGLSIMTFMAILGNVGPSFMAITGNVGPYYHERKARTSWKTGPHQPVMDNGAKSGYFTPHDGNAANRSIY